MTLVCAFVKELKKNGVTGLASDSRQVRPGDLFVVKKGGSFDGAAFAIEAIEKGAVALLTERYHRDIFVPQYISEELLNQEAALAAEFFDHPSKSLSLIGITGTSGKTTTAFLTEHILHVCGLSCGLMGSIEVRTKARSFYTELNTPQPSNLHAYLREMVDQGCKACVMEVSSHGLDQQRVAQVFFTVAVFTNLSPEHLDYHHTFEAYKKAKGKLFAELTEGQSAWLNADEEVSYPTGRAQRYTYGIRESADLKAKELVISAEAIQFTVSFKGQEERCLLPLIGVFNVYNALAAIGGCLSLGISLSQACHALESFSYVPGRLQRVKNTRGIHIIVDHAHKEGALSQVLQTLQELKKSRLITVFGCGGERDPFKRAAMGALASTFSDEVIITNDNPRRESPQAIVGQILEGVKEGALVEIEYDRKEAISKAIQRAAPGDIVLIAGKGHEKVQLFGTYAIPFDDVAVVQEVCAALDREKSKNEAMF